MVKVVLHTEVHPEDNAMLQALYSRSAESVTDHIEKLRTVGSGKFMSQFYLGYGHASIADCGFITVYVEGVSMLCAKAIQDDPLYNGQESSSRYIDWAEQAFLNPYKSEDSQREQDSDELLSSYREFYISQKPVLINHLKQQYPKKEDEKETIYEKAITAKAFDILRGYLPCGSTTNVAWTTSLRKANERLTELSLHPLTEVRNVAKEIHAKLILAYPNSISPLKPYEEVHPYLKAGENFYSDYYSGPFKGFKSVNPDVELTFNIDSYMFKSSGIPNRNSNIHPGNRPRKASLPKHHPDSVARMYIEYDLDFGSYRDLQRHRANYCGMPIVNANIGFHSWYYNKLPDISKVEADKLFTSISNFVNNHIRDVEEDLDLQYLLPMGTLIPIAIETSVRQAVYLAELRSGQTVHATLRPLAQKIGHYLEDKLGIPTTCDFSEDEWNTRRGTQDITSKQT